MVLFLYTIRQVLWTGSSIIDYNIPSLACYGLLDLATVK